MVPVFAFIFKDFSLQRFNPILLACFSFSHFTLTAYWFYRHKTIRKKHPLVAYASPAILLVLGVLLLRASDPILYFIFRLGLFILYWHFAKQAFGVSLWLATESGRKSQALRSASLVCCLSIAAYGIMFVQSLSGTGLLFKYYVPNLVLAPWAPQIFAASAFLSGGVCLYQFARQRSWRGLIPILALAVWLSPDFFVAGLVTAPIFHGLQALPFALTYERSQLGKLALVQLAGIGIGWLLLGVLPEWLSSWNTQTSVALPARFAAIWIFLVNMHHFWLETYSWRRDTLMTLNPEVKEST